MTYSARFLGAGESFEYELLPAPRPAVRAVARAAPAGHPASEETRDSDSPAAAAAAETRDTATAASPPRPPPPPPPPPPRPPRGVAALPKKDPAVFRAQYKSYLQARKQPNPNPRLPGSPNAEPGSHQACLQQHGRKPEAAILELMARLYAESPPSASEAALLGE